MDTVIAVQIVEEGVLRILLPGIRVGQHSLCSKLSKFSTEIGQPDLLGIVESLRHIGRTRIGLVNRFIRRVEIDEAIRCNVLLDLHKVPVEDIDLLQQLAVGENQCLIVEFRPLSVSEGH